jgi:hypothetical protein
VTGRNDGLKSSGSQVGQVAANEDSAGSSAAESAKFLLVSPYKRPQSSASRPSALQHRTSFSPPRSSFVYPPFFSVNRSITNNNHGSHSRNPGPRGQPNNYCHS